MRISAEGFATKQRGHIKDARGRKVSQIDPLTMHLLHQPDTFDATTLSAIAHEDELKVTTNEYIFLTVGVVALCAVSGLFFYSLFFGGLGNAPLAKFSALFYFCSVPWVVWLFIRRKRFHKVAAVLLAYGHCPHCGYNLANLPLDEVEGVTICPECGCAWQLPQPMR